MKRLMVMIVCSFVALTLSAKVAYADPPAPSAKCSQAGCLAGDPGDLNVPNINVSEVSKGAIRTLSFVAGAASVLFLIIGGLRYSSSAGNSSRIEGAKQTILYAIIGLTLSILAVAIVGFVIKSGP
ncbi:MAG TPA: hypothetical protein VMR98_01745 [Candidatus Polarisedimenticolaceae bacterium]|nr:hypothetical protein [Candidatus Polarisedimenticolaceae bacterium]